MLMVIAAAVAMLFGFNAMASAAPQEEAAYFTITASPELAAAADVSARGWDRGTVLDVTTGACIGFRCVTVVVDDNSCGSAGCSTTYSDGSCLVQVTNLAMSYGEKVQNSVVAHEFGHCGGLGHSEVSRDLMFWSMDPTDPNWITSNDRRRMNAAWGASAVKQPKVAVSHHVTHFAAR